MFDPHNWQLTTERLRLRGAHTGDGSLLNAAICESLGELQPWMPWARSAPTLKESVEYAHSCAEKFQRGESLEARIWTHEGTFVGCIGLRPSNLEVPSFNIGYWCHSRYAAQGYTTEATQALAAYALTELRAQRVELYCDVRNRGSRRVAEKSGFTLEAVLHNEARDTAGHLCDACLYARFPPESKKGIDTP